ncbi:MAG: alpha/beta hydrolase [Ilumatobacteraceae bacterium]
MGIRQLRDDDGEHAALHDLGGDGPALLLTHGNGLNAGMWATVVPHLRATFHCFGLDFRGHGASQQTHDPIPVERHWFTAEVSAAVEAIGGRPALAAGHSLGGATLLRTEQQLPGTLRACWVFEPVLVPDTMDLAPPPSNLIEASRRRRLVFASVDEAVDRFRSKPPFAGCEPEAVRAYVEVGTAPQPDGTVKLTCSGDTEASIYETNERLDFADFAAIGCPVVVAAGDGVAIGNELPPMLAPRVAEALADGRLEALPGVTHFAPMEDGALVARSILDHLARFT